MAQLWQFGIGRAKQTVTPCMDWICKLSEVAIAAALAGRGQTRCLAHQSAEPVR